MPIACPNCSASVAEGARFCSQCGTRLEPFSLDRTVGALSRTGRDVFDAARKLTKEAANAAVPAVERTVTTVSTSMKPAIDRAKPAIRKTTKAAGEVVDHTVAAAKRAIDRSKGSAKKVAKKVKRRKA